MGPGQDFMVQDLEDSPIECLDGKKMPRPDTHALHLSSSSDSLETNVEYSLAHRLGLSVTANKQPSRMK